MIKALFGGLAIAIVCALLGPFLVLRRMSLLGDGMAHISFGGVALGILLGINPLICAFVFSVIGALFVQKYITKNENADAAIAVILSTGVGLGIIIIGLARGFRTDLFSYLIGSVLTLSTTDLIIIFSVLIIVLLYIFKFYKNLVLITFNSELAYLSNSKTKIINSIFTILVAMGVVISIRAVGILLITALLVLPTLSAIKVSNSFKKTLIISVIFSVIAMIVGIFISFYLNVPPSGVIVFILLIIYILTHFYK